MKAQWPKLKRDYIGRRARTLREIRSRGGHVIAAGRLVEITDYYRGCQIRPVIMSRGSISRVDTSDLELIPKR